MTNEIQSPQPAPTDEQIENAWLDACGAHQSERERVIAFARSMLARSGSRAVLTAAKVALAEAELLLHKAWSEHDLRSIDDGEGVIRDVAKAADRMDAAHSQVVTHLASLAATSEPDKRAAFEAWAPSVHMRTERWTVNPELYDDEDAISAWHGWAAGVAWVTGQAAPTPKALTLQAIHELALDEESRLPRTLAGVEAFARAIEAAHGITGEPA